MLEILGLPPRFPPVFLRCSTDFRILSWIRDLSTSLNPVRRTNYQQVSSPKDRQARTELVSLLKGRGSALTSLEIGARPYKRVRADT